MGSRQHLRPNFLICSDLLNTCLQDGAKKLVMLPGGILGLPWAAAPGTRTHILPVVSLLLGRVVGAVREELKGFVKIHSAFSLL